MTATRNQRQEVAPSQIFGPRLRATTGGILVLITLIAFEGLAVAAALPTAARELNAIGAIGWAFTAFLVCNVVGMVIAGQMCDRFGAAIPLLIGLACFVAGLLVAGTATSMTQLVAGRGSQGIGSGILITAIYVVLGEAYPDALRPKIFAAMSSAWVLPSLVGPLVAGSLAEHASWRWVFLGLLPFVLVGAGLLLPVLRRLPRHRATGSPLADPRRIVQAVAVALGIASFQAAGQHPSAASIAAGALGVAALIWGLRTLLPPGTVTVRRGVSAPIAMRGLLAGAFFGVDALVPLTLTVQHGYGAVAAGLPLVASGVTWAAGSWWQGRDRHVDSNRVGLIRSGFGFVAAAAVTTALAAQPAVPGWLMYVAWGIAGIGAGLAMSSIGVLLLRYTNDADRGTDSASLQLSDAVSSALTAGLGGVLVAAAARGVLGYTTAFTVLDLAMAGIALVGVALAGRSAAASPRPT
ncbi:MAG: MFS transporter [Actinomycetota bacterium]